MKDLRCSERPGVITAPLFLAVLLFPFTMNEAAADASFEQIEIFVSGTEGYHTFRIPALITTQAGTLLAFCEGRKGGRGDSGDIDLVLKRSFDGGKTWGPLQLVADDGKNTMGNPCPVVDRETGTIWLPLTRNLGEDHEGKILSQESKESRTVWMSNSTDDGATWSQPIEITETTKEPDWTWYATGPGNGIQLASGRLLIPCDYALPVSKTWRSHVIFSDDGGKTWELGGTIGDHVNECQVVEREDGSLLLNMRSYNKKNRRAISTSTDGGITWSEIAHDEALVEPVCQASFIRYTKAANGGKNRVLFSNPADAERVKMTVRLSYDEGATWPSPSFCTKVLPPTPLSPRFPTRASGVSMKEGKNRLTRRSPSPDSRWAG